MIINPFFWRSIPWLEILTKVKEQQIREAHQARYCWCLDNGHGILTQGKRSPVFDGQQLLEYEFNLDIVDRIIEQLEAKGVTYYRTIHRGEQLGNALRLRVKRANEHKSRIPKLFVSIHANAGPARSIQHWADDSISGIETWHHDKSGTGIALARIFQRELVSSFPDWKNRGLRHKSGQQQFYVLKATKMTAVLTENGFYNNRLQVKELMRSHVRQRIADAHVNAILKVEQNGLEPYL